MSRKNIQIEWYPDHTKKEIIIGYTQYHNNLTHVYAVVPGTDVASQKVAEVITKALRRAESRGWPNR